MGSDPMKFAQGPDGPGRGTHEGPGRTRVVDKGDGYQRARQAFSTMLRQYADAAAALTSYYVGGEYYNRDHKGDANGRDPMVPVKAAKQREALEVLATEHPYRPALQLPAGVAAEAGRRPLDALGPRNVDDERGRVPAERADFGDPAGRAEPAAGRRHVGANSRTRRASRRRTRPPLTVAEVFRCLSDSVWSDLPSEKPASDKSTVIRRNLQREHLKKMTALVLGQPSLSGGIHELMAVMRHGAAGTVPPDARSLARLHLKEIAKRIDKALADPKAVPDDAARAHLDECKERIAKALAAAMQME